MDPGLSEVFARHAHKHLFDEVHEVNVRDGGDLRIEGYGFATVFSIWTTIEECLNPPIVWDAGAAAGSPSSRSRAGALHLPGGHRAGGVRPRRARGGPLVPRWLRTCGG